MGVRFRLKELISEKEFREKRVVSLKEIAEETGIHRVTLSKLANNKNYNVGIDTLEKLCRYFDCEIGSLVEYVRES